MAVFARDADTGALTFVQVIKDGENGVDGLDGAYSVTVSADGRHVYAPESFALVALAVRNKLAPGVSESGTSDAFTVVLECQPTADVMMNLISSNENEVTVSPSFLTFTSSNWNRTQTVSVTGVNDDSIDGDQTNTITLAISSTDTFYDALTDPTVTVTTSDDDNFTGVKLWNRY